MPSADFILNLIDKLSAPAKSAASGVLGLESNLKSATTALADMQKAQAMAASNTSITVSGHRAIAAAVQEQKDKVAQLQQAYLDQGGTNAAKAAAKELADQEKATAAAIREADAAARAAKKEADKQARVASSAAAVSKKNTDIDSAKFQKDFAANTVKQAEAVTAAQGEAATAAAAGEAALLSYAATGVAALAAVAVAVAHVVFEFTKLVLVNSDAKRSFLLNLEALLGSASAAEDIDEAVGDLAQHVPVAKDRLQDLAKSLAAAELQGQALKDALAAIATVEATVGSSGADKLRGFLEKTAASGKVTLNAKAFAGTGITEADFLNALAKTTGQSMDAVKASIAAGKVNVEQAAAALDAAVKGKLGGVLDKQSLALPAQIQHFKDNLGDLFEGLAKSPELEGFLRGLKSVLSVFDQNTASGKAFMFIITQVGSALLSSLTRVLPILKQALLMAAIAALRFYIAVKPLMKAKEDQDKAQGGQSAAATGGTDRSGAVGKLAGMPDLSTIITTAFGGDPSAGGNAVGTAITTGLSTGITDGAQSVIDALTGVVGGAVAQAKALLGIASPSKVFAGIGRHTAAGFASGVDADAPRAHGAVGRMLAPRGARGLSQLGGGAGAAMAGAGGRGGGTVSMNGTVINVSGASDPATAAEMVETALGDVMERVMLQLP